MLGINAKQTATALRGQGFKMTLAQYIRSKGHKLTIKRLAEVSLYSETGLWKMYNRDHATIDALIEQHKEQLVADWQESVK